MGDWRPEAAGPMIIMKDEGEERKGHEADFGSVKIKGRTVQQAAKQEGV